MLSLSAANKKVLGVSDFSALNCFRQRRASIYQFTQMHWIRSSFVLELLLGENAFSTQRKAKEAAWQRRRGATRTQHIVIDVKLMSIHWDDYRISSKDIVMSQSAEKAAGEWLNEWLTEWMNDGECAVRAPVWGHWNVNDIDAVPLLCLPFGQLSMSHCAYAALTRPPFRTAVWVGVMSVCGCLSFCLFVHLHSHLHSLHCGWRFIICHSSSSRRDARPEVCNEFRDQRMTYCVSSKFEYRRVTSVSCFYFYGFKMQEFHSLLKIKIKSLREVYCFMIMFRLCLSNSSFSRKCKK